MIFDTFHTLMCSHNNKKLGLRMDPLSNLHLRISSVTGPKTFTKRILHWSMDMILKISELTSIVFFELFKKSFDVKQGF